MARALVARGRARKGAGQKLLLKASRGLSHLFVLLRTYTANCVPSSSFPSPRHRLPDSVDRRPFKPRAPIPLASGARCSSLLFSTSNAPFYPHLFRSTSQASPPPNAFRQKFGTRSRASSPDTSSAPGSLYLHFTATSPSDASSAWWTFISAKTRTTGTELSTSSTESR